MLRTIIIFTLMSLSIQYALGSGPNTATAEGDDNSIVLSKAFVINAGDKSLLRAVLPSSNMDLIYTTLYFDADMNCRKATRHYTSSDSSLFVSADYSKTGHLIAILICDSQPEGKSYNVTSTYVENEFFAGVKYDYVIIDNSWPEYTHCRKYGSALNFSQYIDEWNMTEYLSVDNLFFALKILPLDVPQNCTKIHFVTPKRGDIRLM